ncbi:hypothetical protein ABIA31_000304 [Catenulispora sp. MAP5-51]
MGSGRRREGRARCAGHERHWRRWRRWRAGRALVWCAVCDGGLGRGPFRVPAASGRQPEHAVDPTIDGCDRFGLGSRLGYRDQFWSHYQLRNRPARPAGHRQPQRHHRLRRRRRDLGPLGARRRQPDRERVMEHREKSPLRHGRRLDLPDPGHGPVRLPKRLGGLARPVHRPGGQVRTEHPDRRRHPHLPPLPAAGPAGPRTPGRHAPRRLRQRHPGRAGLRMGPGSRPQRLRRGLPRRPEPRLEHRRRLLRHPGETEHRRRRLHQGHADDHPGRDPDRPGPHLRHRHLQRRHHGLPPGLRHQPVRRHRPRLGNPPGHLPHPETPVGPPHPRHRRHPHPLRRRRRPGLRPHQRPTGPNRGGDLAHHRRLRSTDTDHRRPPHHLDSILPERAHRRADQHRRRRPPVAGKRAEACERGLAGDRSALEGAERDGCVLAVLRGASEGGSGRHCRVFAGPPRISGG